MGMNLHGFSPFITARYCQKTFKVADFKSIYIPDKNITNCKELYLIIEVVGIDLQKCIVEGDGVKFLKS